MVRGFCFIATMMQEMGHQEDVGSYWKQNLVWK